MVEGWDAALGKHDEPTAPRTLHRIAALLGVPAEDFYDERAGEGFGDARECLRLWSLMRTEGDRERVLAYMRGVVDEERR